MSDYPECERRLAEASKQAQPVGEFLDWLQAQGVQHMVYREESSWQLDHPHNLLLQVISLPSLRQRRYVSYIAAQASSSRGRPASLRASSARAGEVFQAQR